jgi:hypothetical protein
MWALSLIHVLLLSRFSAPTIESRKWRNRLNFLNVSPETYTYPFFQSQCAVYVKLPFHPVDPSHPVCSQHGHFYVGSTGMSASKRDFNRAAKLKLLENGQAVHVELSIRYWLSNNNFPLFNLIVLEPHSTYEQAWVREHCLLGYWQTMLNHPLFLVLRLKSEGWTLQFQASRSPPIKLGPRLFSALAKTSSHCGQCSQ